VGYKLAAAALVFKKICHCRAASAAEVRQRRWQWQRRHGHLWLKVRVTGILSTPVNSHSLWKKTIWMIAMLFLFFYVFDCANKILIKPTISNEFSMYFFTKNSIKNSIVWFLLLKGILLVNFEDT